MPASFSKAVVQEAEQQYRPDSQEPQGSVKQKGTRKKWLKFAIRAGVTLLLFTFLLKSVSWSTLFNTLMHVHRAPLMVGLAIGVVCLLFSVYGWRALLQAEHIKTDLARLINLYLVGIAFSHFLPTSMGGDVVKAYYIGRESGNTAGSASAVMLSRITGFIGMLTIALPTLFIWRAWFTQKLIIGFLLLSLLILVMIGGTILLSVLLPKASSRFLGRGWMNHPFVIMALEVGQTLSIAARRPRSLGIAILYAILFWISSFLNYYGYAMALKMQAPFHFYVIAVSLSSIIAFLPISINGFGVRESAMVYVFSTIHVPADTSLLLAFLMDIQVLFFGVIGGGIYLAMNDVTSMPSAGPGNATE
ncbi:MAG TPA: lysylphosphatidylglycerol synthase transmembrane domain-containing protein [Ktedonosporobacter sp.]|nr:lysylphosphatidylglycerol synthase transmembrane domain-containing protein [Ktedonosporobacter sp.]